MGNDELDLDEALNLLNAPSSGTRTKKPRSDSGDEDRTVRNWFDRMNRSHTHNDCEVPGHKKLGSDVRKGLTTQIHGMYVCRECYMSELDKDA